MYTLTFDSSLPRPSILTESTTLAIVSTFDVQHPWVYHLTRAIRLLLAIHIVWTLVDIPIHDTIPAI